MYDPQQNDHLDFEMGSFGSFVKKAVKGGAKALGKVTDATITKPSMMIGKAIGGKKGEAIGKKLGGFTSTVTKLGVGAGAAGALAPLVTTAGPAVLTGVLAKKVLGSKAGKSVTKSLLGRKGGVSTKAHFAAEDAKARKSSPKPGYVAKKTDDNALAAKVAAMLVAKLGGPLAEANKALKLADLQRTATFEHKKLMSDADFRKKVLAGIAQAASEGNAGCQRTIRVLVQR